MGSWAATCAVSRLGINPGDKVFFILSKKTYIRGTYDLMSSLGSCIRNNAANDKYIEKQLKTLADMDERKSENDELRQIITDSIESWKKLYRNDVVFGWGEYDDYGGVEDFEIPDDVDDEDEDDNGGGNFMPLVFIRANVAKDLIKLGQKMLSEKDYGTREDEYKAYRENEAMCIAIACHSTRVQLFGANLLGRQYPEFAEYREISTLQSIIFKEFLKEWGHQIWKDIQYKWEFLDIDIKYWFKNLFSRKAK